MSWSFAPCIIVNETNLDSRKMAVKYNCSRLSPREMIPFVTIALGTSCVDFRERTCKDNTTCPTEIICDDKRSDSVATGGFSESKTKLESDVHAKHQPFSNATGPFSSSSSKASGISLEPDSDARTTRPPAAASGVNVMRTFVAGTVVGGRPRGASLCSVML